MPNTPSGLVPIPIIEIINAVHGTHITMPGSVTKRKEKFTVKVIAEFSGTIGNVTVKVAPHRGWKLPVELTVKYVSIKRAHGQSLKHRGYFPAHGDIRLNHIGRGDYVLQVF